MTASFPHPRSVSSARSIGAGVFVRVSGPVRVGKGRPFEFPATHSHIHRAAPKFQHLDGSRRDIHPAVQAFSRSRLLAAGLNWCGLLARSSFRSSRVQFCQEPTRRSLKRLSLCVDPLGLVAVHDGNLTRGFLWARADNFSVRRRK